MEGSRRVGSGVRSGRPHQVRSGRDLRGDLADRGPLRVDVADVPRPPLRAPKNSIDECKDRDFTYAAPALRHRRVHQQRRPARSSPRRSSWATSRSGPTGRTFVINGTERVVVSQLVRRRVSTSTPPSTRRPTRTSSPPRSSRPGVPGWRWRSDKRDMVGVRIDRKRKQSRDRPPQGPRLDHRADPRGVRRVRVHARHPGEGPHPGPGRRAARHLPQAASGRAPHA
ncbi:hypothetical protein LV779_22325 [Streptomyces thinghirensis]|nr:hypothetical protein [Streptomyces thinghirensis]